MSTYRCHRLQEIKIYCCVSCSAIVHKSCWDRTRNWTHIQDHKIYCSNTCKIEGEKQVKLRERLEEQGQKLEDLENEIKQKIKYIEKLETTKASFLNDVCETEQYWQDENYKLKTEIHELKSLLLKNKLNTKEETSRKVVETGCQTDKTENRSAACQTLTKMVTSSSQTDVKKRKSIATDIATQTLIETAVSKSCCTQTELEEDQVQEMLLLNALMKICVNKSVQTDTQAQEHSDQAREMVEVPVEIEVDTYTHSRKPQMLIVTNSNLHGIIPIIKQTTANGYDINYQFEHKGMLGNMLDCAEKYKHKMTKNDAVVIINGPDTARRGSKVGKEVFDRFLTSLAHTNIITIGCILTMNRPVLNQFMESINNTLKSLCSENCHYIDPNICIARRHVSKVSLWHHKPNQTDLKRLVDLMVKPLLVKQRQRNQYQKSAQEVHLENEEFAKRLERLRSNDVIISKKSPPEINILQSNEVMPSQTSPITAWHLQEGSPIEDTLQATEDPSCKRPTNKTKNSFFRTTNQLSDTGWLPRWTSTQCG